MVAADRSNMLKARPFIPFEIEARDGLRYEVRHPELVFVTESTIVLGSPGVEPGGLPEHLGHILSVAQIIRLVPRPANATA